VAPNKRIPWLDNRRMSVLTFDEGFLLPPADGGLADTVRETGFADALLGVGSDADGLAFDAGFDGVLAYDKQSTDPHKERKRDNQT
jgi:hypothetical protein